MGNTLKGKTVLLGVTGSIAAYKAASLASLLMASGAETRVLMTESACNIINPITFETLTGHKCLIDTFDRNFEFKVNHVSLAEKADIFVISPATANTIAKLANGLADNMLTSVFLASKCPKLIFPAMNTAMLENPITQNNIEKLKSYGVKVIESETGQLACGKSGKGRMSEPETIFSFIENEISCKKDFLGKKVLVTAGATQEAIDPVRFITNHSSGKMGYALAKKASARGADVTLISGPTEIKPPVLVKTIFVKSAKEMFDEVKREANKTDIVIKAAAVADYTPSSYSKDKIKKKDKNLSLSLERTEDILSFLGKNKKEGQFLVGFSMETKDLIENSKRKLKEKKLDLIVANSLTDAGSGFRGDTNRITIIGQNFEKEYPLSEKEEVADFILDEIKNEIDEK